MVLFSPQLAPGRNFSVRPAAAGSNPQNDGANGSANGVNLLQQQNLQRADQLAATCASCGSGGGCNCGGNASDIKTAVQNGQNPDAAFEAFKQKQYNEIFAHESAHQSAAGGLGGGINIEYGPNGVPVAGHVNVRMPSIDEKNPETSLRDAQTVKRAALAPSDPSSQDKSVAAQVQSLMGRAQVMIQQKQARDKATPIAGTPAQNPQANPQPGQQQAPQQGLPPAVPDSEPVFG